MVALVVLRMCQNLNLFWKVKLNWMWVVRKETTLVWLQVLLCIIGWKDWIAIFPRVEDREKNNLGWSGNLYCNFEHIKFEIFLIIEVVTWWAFRYLSPNLREEI